MNLIIKLIRSLFTSRNNIYPVKYKKHEKSKSKAKSAADTVSVEHSAADYSEVINDYPTLFTQDGLK